MKFLSSLFAVTCLALPLSAQEPNGIDPRLQKAIQEAKDNLHGRKARYTLERIPDAFCQRYGQPMGCKACVDRESSDAIDHGYGQVSYGRNKIGVQELLAGRNGECANLERHDMSSLDLTGVSLDGAMLYECRMPAKMPGARLSWAVLKQARFENADLSRADLSFADLTYAEFTGRNTFSEANLYRADFREAKLAGVSFEYAQLQSADFRGADLRGARFNGADMKGAEMDGAILTGAHYDSDTKLPFLFLAEQRAKGLGMIKD